MVNPDSLRITGQYAAPVLNIAHRGARAFAPENTLAAFEKAKTFGCQMFEIDVRMCKDEELVVHHDDQLLRCTDAGTKFPGRSTYAVSDFSYDELSRLDAGSWYIDQLALIPSQRQAFLQTLTNEELARFVSPQDRALYASGEIRIPTLKQTLELARRTDLMVNIELKAQEDLHPGLADAVVKLVERMGMDHRVLISSFDHAQLVKVRKLTKIIATGVLTDERIMNPVAYLQSLDADAYNPDCYGDCDSAGIRKLNVEGIHTVRESGHSVNVWTCNNKDDMRILIAAGVTGLISDFPNRVRDVLIEQSFNVER